MLNAIIRFSLANRRLVLVLSALLIATGLFSMGRLSIDAFPDTTDVMVQINTVAPALGPVEVERQITARIEQALGGLPSLRLTRSVSKFGLSQVTVVFEDGTDLYFARQQVMERVSTLELPERIPRPTLGPVATGLGESFHYIVTAPGGDLADTRTLHDWVIKPVLVSVPGVAEVNSWGGLERRFEVIVDPLRLIKHGLTLGDVTAALARSNVNVGGGVARTSGEILLVHGKGILQTVEEIGAVAIAAEDGRFILVRDVADVAEGHEIRRGVVTYQGRGEAVLGLGFMLMGENSHDVAGRLRERLGKLQKVLPHGSKVEVVYDRSELVQLVLRTVRQNLFEGALLVIAVLFLFLGHFRAAAIVAVAIPLSMLFAFNLMLRAGIAGTLMSLGAIDFGLIVDSSVIMVENAVRRLGSDATDRPVVAVVEEAAQEVRKPTMFGELVIMIVYLPILALEGVEGKLFKPMALTVVFALAGSLILSLTLMPVLASYLLSRRTAGREEPWITRGLKRLYRPAVEWAIANRLLVLGCGAILILGTIPLALGLGAVFVPKLDEGSIVINTVRLPGVSIEESARFGTRIERLLLIEFPDEIETIWTRTGTPEVATDPMGIEVSDVFVMLTPAHRWRRARTKEELRAQMDRILKRLPGMNFAFTQPIEMRFNEMIAGIRTDLGVKIYGHDFERLQELAERAREILQGIRGAESVSIEPMVGQPMLEIELDAAALSRYGLQARDVLDPVEALGGLAAGEVRVEHKRFPLAVRLPQRYADHPERIGSLLISAPGGQRLPLSSLAAIRRVSGPLVVNRENGVRRALVTANVGGRDLGGFAAEARLRIEAELGPTLRELGYPHPGFGGQYENLERASRRLAYIVPIALMLILFLIYSTYQNVVDTMRVFASVPFAIAGGVLALWIRDMPFSISAGVGFIALSGVSVLADMVLVSTIRQLVDAGMPIREAVLEACARRLRPVLMTTLVASLGFLPMAFNTGVGAEVQRPLATVVIGGMITSTIQTLFMLPTFYLTLRGSKEVQAT
jgi:cobalt-zinc-cadmium resistance protein CzcA